MTLEELEKDQVLFDTCMQEVEERVRGGQDPEQAKFEVFKARGVQFDEDDIDACAWDHRCGVIVHWDAHSI